MGKFQNGSGNWTNYRQLANIREVDFHPDSFEESDDDYYQKMEKVGERALSALKEAHRDRVPCLLMTHGHSTSDGWKRPTARSVIRNLMRGPDATPYIERKHCIQHDSVFVVAIRNPSKAG